MSEPAKDELVRYERWWAKDGRPGARLLTITLMASLVIIPGIGVASERFLGWGWGSIVGPFMNDELAVQHRARALHAGFLVLLAGSVLVAIASWFAPLHWLRIGAAAVAYLGFATAAIRFALLERQSEEEAP